MSIKERRMCVRRRSDHPPLGLGNPSVIVYCSDYSYRAWIRFHDLETLASVMLLDYRQLTWVTSNDKDDGHVRQHGHPVPQHLRPRALKREDEKT